MTVVDQWMVCLAVGASLLGGIGLGMLATMALFKRWAAGEGAKRAAADLEKARAAKPLMTVIQLGSGRVGVLGPDGCECEDCKAARALKESAAKN